MRQLTLSTHVEYIFCAAHCCVDLNSNNLAVHAGVGHLQLHMVLTAALLVCLQQHASAIFGGSCRIEAEAHVEKAALETPRWDPLQCSKHVCGNVPETEVRFYERLSPQCSALMEKYRSIWSLNGQSNLMEARPCTTAKWTIGPTGPILV